MSNFNTTMRKSLVSIQDEDMTARAGGSFTLLTEDLL